MCWENTNATSAEQSQCRATWDTYLNIIGEEYPRPWTPAVASRVEDEERRWANLPYETFVMRWDPADYQLAGVGIVGLGGRVGSAISAPFVLACVGVLVATGAVSIAIALPQRQPIDWSLPRVEGTAIAPPIPLDRDIPRPTATPGSDEDYYFRGTTIGFAGSSALQRIGVTPTTTQPGVATAFATVAETEHGGSGIVYIASSIVDSKKPWIVAGLAFDTIGKDNVLSLSLSETDYINVRVIEITLYGKQVDEITRGLTARLILDSETDFSISEVGYLYKQN